MAVPTRTRTPPSRFLTRLDQLEQLTPGEQEVLERVAERYTFRAPRRYLDLIDWRDPDDPIRRLIVPQPGELEDGGRLDASNEASITVAPGTQHKYPDTALLLCNEVCGGFCRYCFRKRLFMQGNTEVSLDTGPGLAYIATHPEITDVLLTGGDPLMLSPDRLLSIVRAVAAIEHVQVVRIGSKMPAFDPGLVLERTDLIDGLAAVVADGTSVYLVTHFDHPRELGDEAAALLRRMQSASLACVNQCPIVRGINDDADTLAALFQQLCRAGVAPYYLFQGRPTAGNAPFDVPIVAGYRAFDTARSRVSGLAGRARMVLSHELGKLEVAGVDGARLYLRFHRAKHPDDRGRFMTFERNDDAYWLDDLVPCGDVGPRVAAMAAAAGPR